MARKKFSIPALRLKELQKRYTKHPKIEGYYNFDGKDIYSIEIELVSGCDLLFNKIKLGF